MDHERILGVFAHPDDADVGSGGALAKFVAEGAEVSLVVATAGDAGRYVGENAVQLHGGIGVTDELEVGDYFKRLIYTDYLLGSADFHLSRLETLLV